MGSLSNLCLRCGLCCDGSLFVFVAIDEREETRLRTLGIEVGRHRGRRTMPLPCGKLNGRCCTVYGERPQGCRAFVCRLGAQLQRGEVGFEQAQQVVLEAQRRIEAVREAWPGVGTLRQAQQALSDPARPVPGLGLERLHRATAWLRQHF